MMQKGKRALAIAPFHDPPTGTTSLAQRALIGFMEAEGMEVDVLEGRKAERGQFEALIEADDYDLILYFGHGLEDAWLGQVPADRPLMDLANANRVKGSIVVAIACDTLSRLGPEALAKTCKGYIGYTSVVVAPWMERADRDYRADFVRTFITPAIGLVMGYTLNEAVLETKDLCEEYARLYELERPEFYYFFALCQRYNAEHLSYVGHPRVKL